MEKEKIIVYDSIPFTVQSISGNSIAYYYHDQACAQPTASSSSQYSNTHITATSQKPTILIFNYANDVKSGKMWLSVTKLFS